MNPTEPKKEDLFTRIKDFTNSALITHEVYIQRMVHQNDAQLVTNVRENLMKEYNSLSSTELLIIDLAAIAYCRSMRTNVTLNYYLNDTDGHLLGENNKERMMIIRELTKHSEASYRQFFSAITLLRQLKQPPVNIKIQTKKAFVGQNQQFNKNA